MIYFLTTVEDARREGPSVKPSNGIKWTRRELCARRHAAGVAVVAAVTSGLQSQTPWAAPGGRKWTEVGGRKPLHKHFKMTCISTEQFETRRQTGVGGAAPETRRRF